MTRIAELGLIPLPGNIRSKDFCFDDSPQEIVYFTRTEIRSLLSELSFTHISLLTEVLTVIHLAVIFHNTVHLFELSNEPSENTITI